MAREKSNISGTQSIELCQKKQRVGRGSKGKLRHLKDFL